MSSYAELVVLIADFSSCWELFLYPAIVEGVIAKTDILDAYTNPPVLPDGNRATVAHSVLRKLEDISVRQNLGGVVRVDRQTQTCNLQPGDLVIQPAQDDDRYVRDPPRLDDSLDNVMWHVMIVMEIPADRDFEEIKVRHFRLSFVVLTVLDDAHLPYGLRRTFRSRSAWSRLHPSETNVPRYKSDLRRAASGTLSIDSPDASAMGKGSLSCGGVS